MNDRPDDPESGAGEARPPKIKAEDNPWYLLATLYGVPQSWSDGLREKNRVAWNRYFAADLDEETRAKLIEEKRHPAEELRPFSPEELEEVKRAFAKRCKASAKKLMLPASNADIDFSDVEFEHDAFFEELLFSSHSFFNGAAFSGRASFYGATFSGRASFGGAAFSGRARFGGAAFSGRANFYGATFSGGAFFADAAFSGDAFFAGAAFPGEAFFAGAAFSGEASFDSAAFSGDAFFDSAAFSRWAIFDGAAFSSKASFGGAAFSGGANFDGATISGGANFDGAAFSGEASFGYATFGEESSFVNAEMKGETSFEGAIFDKEPPRFFGAKLHQGTVWRRIAWPKPKDKDTAGSFLDAYACLKLEMDRLKKHEDELDFFALELQSRRVEQGPARGLPIAIYRVLSGYGRSYVRPLIALFVVVAIGAGAFSYFDGRTCGEALGLSVANTLNVFGFRKDFDLAIDTPLAWLKVFSAIQTILGAILLFLFGLGIRNKFRMK